MKFYVFLAGAAIINGVPGVSGQTTQCRVRPAAGSQQTRQQPAIPLPPPATGNAPPLPLPPTGNNPTTPSTGGSAPPTAPGTGATPTFRNVEQRTPLRAKQRAAAIPAPVPT